MNTFVNTTFNNKKVNYIIVKDDPWFRGKDIATILEYADTKQALRVNVDTEDKQKLENPPDYNEQVNALDLSTYKSIILII